MIPGDGNPPVPFRPVKHNLWSGHGSILFVLHTVTIDKMLTRMHSSRMRTADSLPYEGVFLTETPLDRPPRDRDPLDRNPLDGKPCGQRPPWTEIPLDRDTPRDPTPLETSSLTETPL